MRIKRSSGNVLTSLNLTPMIDCVFQLLIFFMLVNKFDQIMVELQLPKASEAKKMPGDFDRHRVIINVDSKGQYNVSNNVLTLEQLIQQVLRPESKISVAEDKSSNLVVIIRADRTTDYIHVQKLLIECMKLGVWKLYVFAIQEK
ncbi:MAG: biopolymer transporter ExbD [Planctomycetota bacterium]